MTIRSNTEIHLLCSYEATIHPGFPPNVHPIVRCAMFMSSRLWSKTIDCNHHSELQEFLFWEYVQQTTALPLLLSPAFVYTTALSISTAHLLRRLLSIEFNEGVSRLFLLHPTTPPSIFNGNVTGKTGRQQ